MDHEVICDCSFKDTCGTYSDRLIDEWRKGPKGFGCHGRSDFYRSRHCKTFSCRYLSVILSDILAPRSDGLAQNR